MEEKNFLDETLADIQDLGKNDADVAWVGSVDGEFAISFEEFRVMASFTYDAGIDGDEILPTLVVVFNDGSWLERNEYDGSSWWEYKRTPIRSENATSFSISDNKHQLLPKEQAQI